MPSARISELCHFKMGSPQKLTRNLAHRSHCTASRSEHHIPTHAALSTQLPHRATLHSADHHPHQSLVALRKPNPNADSHAGKSSWQWPFPARRGGPQPRSRCATTLQHRPCPHNSGLLHPTSPAHSAGWFISLHPIICCEPAMTATACPIVHCVSFCCS